MFSFFKKKEVILLKGWEKELFQYIFKLLGDEFKVYEIQVTKGIIEAVRIDKNIADYINFKLNVQLLNEFEKRNERMFTINGIKIYDKTTSEYKTLNLDLGFGLILGYSVKDIFNFNPDSQKIKVDTIYKTYICNNDFDKIRFLFTKEEETLLNVSDVYELEFERKVIYHLKDIENGDFIGIDIDKNIYKVTHDPFELKLLSDKLKDIL